MKTLWLASWYPNKISPYNGDFIMRHAQAASLYEEVQVIHIVKDEKGVVTQDIKIEETKNGQLAEKIIYYHLNSRIPFFSKLVSAWKYRSLYRNAIRQYLETNTPAIVHVHVGMNAGPIAMWLKRKMKIPYVLTEHWTGFLEEARHRFEHLPAYVQNAWSRVARHAASVSFVSRYLEGAYMKKFPCSDSIVIPNVVDHDIFYPSTIANSEARFIHVSGLDERKNFQGILQAFGLLLRDVPNAELIVFGAVNDNNASIIKEAGLEKNVFIHGEEPQHVLAEHIRKSVASILYSDCETFGCVIIEANASGVPVIVSDIPVFHELVTEGVNGYFATAKNPAALATRMLEMLNRRTAFETAVISDMTRARYSYETVGKQFSDWYNKVLEKISRP